MTINIQPITNAEIYVYGSWTSQILYNSTAGFPTGTTSEWGYLAWDESNTGTGYTGHIRIDIIDADTGLILLGDIAQNTDLSSTDITSLSTADIQIKVKMYGLDYPTPILNNLRVKFKNWNQEQVVTHTGKNVLLNRALSTTTTTPIHDFRIGSGQITALTESSTDITNAVSAAFPITGDPTVNSLVTYIEDEEIVEITFGINNGDIIIPNWTVMDSIGFRNDDATQLFVGGCRHADITKNPSFYYYYKITYKIYGYQSDNYIITKNGRNILLNRMFKSVPTYTGIFNGSCGYQTNTLVDSMTAIDSTYYGPTAFQYTLLDTTKYRLTTSIAMDQSSGNGYTYNAITNMNDDGTEILMYAATLDEDIQKSSTYTYQFNTNHNMLTPVSILV